MMPEAQSVSFSGEIADLLACPYLGTKNFPAGAHELLRRNHRGFPIAESWNPESRTATHIGSILVELVRIRGSPF